MAHYPPPAAVPGWPSSNFSNPQSKGPMLIVVELLLVSVVYVIVLLRIYSSIYLKKMFGFDDWFILPATIFCVGLTTTTCLATFRYGWGKHIWDITTVNAEKSQKLSWISELFFTWSLTSAKLSLCCLYLRLLGNSNTYYNRRLVYVCAGIVTLWALGFTAVIVTQCDPIKAVWTINYPKERCINIRAGLIAHAALDIVTDLFLYILPIPKALSSRLPRERGCLLVGLFAVGAVVCTAAVIRVPYSLRSTNGYDTTWYIYDSYIWTTVEVDLAIICACMPSLAPILAKVIPNYPCSVSGSQQQPRRIALRGSTNMSYSGSLIPAFPHAHISTTASSTAVTGSSSNSAWYQHWCGGCGGRGAVSSSASNESEEKIIGNSTDILTNIATGRGASGITKTTVIEQSVSVDSGSCSPSVVDPMATAKIVSA